MAVSASGVADVRLEQRYFDSRLIYGTVCLTHMLSHPLGTRDRNITINTLRFH